MDMYRRQNLEISIFTTLLNFTLYCLSWYKQKVKDIGGLIVLMKVFIIAFRYTIKEIIIHPFFQEDCGVKVNLVEPEPGIDSDHTKPVGTVKLLLQLEDPKKRKDKHKENEGIQFDFNLGTDQPEKVTLELVSDPCVIL